MHSAETTATIIVKPKTAQGWVVVTPLLRSDIYFQVRQRALQFARAYAKLNRPARIQIFGETGELDAEEAFPDVFHGSPGGDVLAGPRLVAVRD